jgi:hypothetical protein
MIHLLRPPHYVRERIPEICSTWDGLATVPMSQTGS